MPKPLAPTLSLAPALALVAGAVLALMTDINSQLAHHSSPLFASWVAHGIGAAGAGALLALTLAQSVRGTSGPATPAPVWAWLGGIPGAFTVVLAAITVNSPLGLSGTLAMVLVGQMLFGVTADLAGLFGLARRRFGAPDVAGLALVLVLAGSILLIAARG